MEPDAPMSQPSYSAAELTPVKMHLPWFLIALVGVGALIALATWFAMNSVQTALNASPALVNIENEGFNPATVKIREGQSVTWLNNDVTEHQLAGDKTANPEMQTGSPLENGESYTYPFEARGTYHYYDPADPTKYKGSVVVE